MSESADLVSAFVHGLAGGVMMVLALTILNSRLNAHVRAASALAGLSVVAWLITESPTLTAAIGQPYAFWLILVACPVSGLFWLMVLTVFDDWRVTPLTLAPAIVLHISGMAMQFAEPPVFDV